MLRCAREKYILCDSTKLNQTTLCTFISTKDITALITDDEANPEYVEKVRAAGLDVIVASIDR